MHDRVNLLHDLIYEQLIENRAVYESKAVKLLEVSDVLAAAGGQVIEGDYLMPISQKYFRQVTSDKTGAPSYEISLAHYLPSCLARLRDRLQRRLPPVHLAGHRFVIAQLLIRTLLRGA
jgi:hypothetical protein